MIKLNKERYNLTSPEAKKFQVWIENISLASVSDKPLPNSYLFSPWMAGFAYLVGLNTNISKFKECCIKEWDKILTAEEKIIEDLRTGKSTSVFPDIAFDSYLRSGKYFKDGAFAISCGADTNLTERTVAYLTQAMINLFNPKTASWGGVSRPWSGWAFRPPYGPKPENNYFVSHFGALIYWAEVVQDWKAERDWAFELLEQYYKEQTDGGPAEGTGYGRALGSLYSLMQTYRDFTGIDCPYTTRHAEGTLEYLAHAIYPSFTHMVAIGDQSNESSHILAEADKVWVNNAAALAKDESKKRLGIWLMNNMIIERAKDAPYLLHNYLTKPIVEPENTTKTSYLAKYLGHYFERSEGTNPDWMWFSAGPNDQSHEAHDQGSIGLFSNGKIILNSQTTRSHSGILQNPIYQNTVAFQVNGQFLNQVRSKIGVTLEPIKNGYKADLTGSIPSAASGSTWTRTVIKQVRKLVVTDTIELAPNVNAFICWNTPFDPRDNINIVNEIATMTLGDVTMSCNNVKLVVDVIDWKQIDSLVGKFGGYSIRVPVKSQVITTEFLLPKGFSVLNDSHEEEENMKDKIIEDLRKELQANQLELESLKTQVQDLTEIDNTRSKLFIQMETRIKELEAAVDIYKKFVKTVTDALGLV